MRFNKKKVKSKIDSAACTGSHEQYMKYFSFPWPPVVVAHDRTKKSRLL